MLRVNQLVGFGNRKVYDADAQAYFTRAGITDPAYMAAQNTLIAGLKSDLGLTNLSDGFDCFWIFANQDDGGLAALYNAAKNDHNATNINSTPYVAGEGFTGNGSNRRLVLDFIPATDAVVFTQNGCSWGAYGRATSTGSRDWHGATIAGTSGISFQPTYGTLTGMSINGAWSNQTNAATQGFFIASRTGSGTNDGALYLNGSALTGAIGVSASPVNLECMALCRNDQGTPSNFTNQQLAVLFYGKGFTAGQVASINARVEAYMDALGKGVQ